MKNGNQMLDELSKMTETARETCVFPGYFNDKEFDIFLSELANNEDLSENQYEAVLETDKFKMAEWTRQAINENYEMWGEFVQAVKDFICAKALEEAKRLQNEEEAEDCGEE